MEPAQTTSYAESIGDKAELQSGIECKIIDIVEKHNIVVLEGLAAYFDNSRKEKRTVHAIGDGTFVTDGRRLNRREMMRSKIPDGIRQ